MFWNAGGFGYVIVLITLGLKKCGWYVAVSTKKFIEVRKSKIILFSFKTDLVHFFCEEVNFLTATARTCRRCGQFDIGVTFFSFSFAFLDYI